jgi:hypothetical protein
MLSDFCLLVTIFDVIINSNNFNNITKINHIGVMLKYAKIAKEEMVYKVSEITSNFAPVFDVHFNFLAK